MLKTWEYSSCFVLAYLHNRRESLGLKFFLIKRLNSAQRKNIIPTRSAERSMV